MTTSVNLLRMTNAVSLLQMTILRDKLVTINVSRDEDEDKFAIMTKTVSLLQITILRDSEFT